MKQAVWLFILLFSWVAWAQFQVPPLTGPVVDSARMISSEDQALIERMIRSFHQLGKGQIQVLTVPSLNGVPIEQASIQVTDRWKLGEGKKDDGVLIMVSEADRRMRIEVGQGLEGVLTDLGTKQIIEDVMIPLFRKGSPSQGILAGTYQVMKTIDPTFEPEGVVAPSRVSRGPKGLFDRYEGLLFLIFIVLMILSNLFRPRRRRGFWGGPGGFGGWGGSGGGWGGGGGGGWSGGGGGFSGGGSSGSW